MGTSSESLVSLLDRHVKTIKFVDSESLEKRLTLRVRNICAKIRKLKGRARASELKKETKFDVYYSDCVSAGELSQQVTSLTEKVHALSGLEESVEQLSAQVTQQKKLLQTSEAVVNCGKSYDDVQVRQKARKV